VPDAARALLVYDGSCGFCERSAEWIRSKWPPSGEYAAVSWQQLGDSGLTALGLTTDDVSRAAWWIDDRRREGGHVAVAWSLVAARGGWGALGRLLLVPPFRWLAAPGYRLVAANRGRLPGHTSACRT
jgi:predicted DCC family thiol-disulfide oxidoreductase YuxK